MQLNYTLKIVKMTISKYILTQKNFKGMIKDFTE